MSTDTAKQYWRSQKVYPFPFTKKRRIYELNYILPRLERVQGRRLLDLGCGDGSLLECLLRLTDFEELYGFDVSEHLLREVNARVKTRVYDMAAPGELPEVDATIIAGVIQYLFDDHVVASVLSRVTSPIVWIRSSCTTKAKDELVERDGYASKYRTLPNTYDLISQHFDVSAVDRVYPDEIESPFGTKQYYFEGRRRS